MAARDDSVIRGSLIACLIFLVLSVALNIFFYLQIDTKSTEKQTAEERLGRAQDEIRTLEDQALTFKAMLGVGQITKEKYESLATTKSGDQEMDTIAELFIRSMANFENDFPEENRNYPALPDYLVKAIRSRNEQLKSARTDVVTIREQAKNDVENARKLQVAAEGQRDEFQKTLATEQQKYADDRTRINQEKEKAKDEMRKTSIKLTEVQKAARVVESGLKDKQRLLKSTIETQRIALNDLRSDSFETVQGNISYVMRGRNIVTINLGSGDQLRPGVTFGVIDADETRLKDAKVKATIQVTKITALHLAEARVVALPDISTPIIEGDKIYSPFWAPGRRVKIALAGNIDIDGDKRPDNDELIGMVQAAGAEVAAQISPEGAIEGTLDATIRFLVVGEAPEVGTDSDNPDDARLTAAMGNIKQKATELGLTIIPAWKLEAYLKTINDTLTTPLGTAAKADDFPPTRTPGTRNRLPNSLPDLFQRDTDKMQKGNKILSP